MVAFGLGFFVILLVLTERNSGISESRAAMVFKRGAKAAITRKATDEEAAGLSHGSDAIDEQNISETANSDKPPPMINTFSWQQLTYTISTSGGGHRRILNDIAGYVAPGKLTALMGESGAGKVCAFP